MIIGGTITSQSTVLSLAPELNLMVAPINKPITPSVITVVNATSDYAMVNESGEIWVNEAGIQMVAQ